MFCYEWVYLWFISLVFGWGLKMVWNVGRISNIVFCPKSPNFYQYLSYTELQDGKKGKKMFDFKKISMLKAT